MILNDFDRELLTKIANGTPLKVIGTEQRVGYQGVYRRLKRLKDKHCCPDIVTLIAKAFREKQIE